MPDRFGDKIRLQHAYDAIDTIMGYIRDADFDVFSQDQMLRDACLRQIQIIGESCRNLSQDIRDKYKEVPWREIIGLRINSYTRIFWCRRNSNLGNYAERSSSL
jgi:uncharacterized protein with HEPN domain